ncbi:ribosomal L7Ae/L30e/S12e/Gadd45 family protein [Clostridium kluyveri]|uniref:Ribosomal protein L7Ae family protein n=1 Tax=Clostridium kluyveri TaxID=1534 RepID=A0A1L5F712_CLOKL|nr:ribosomal L7Ae/L30e/S12e/Gadd45 family protein [Clostridium kluyveri]APM38795.1 ribosomal protein L7Ae family protein [Clostridium kluyveri]UZQ51113.1 ribosomal L7Ae/L30e/S12e/Gadd45 family protein [Clostridium kluyveri]
MKNKFLGFIGLIKRAGKLLEGYNICEEKIKKNKVYFIVMCHDISENTWNKFLNYSNKYKIPIAKLSYSKEELGNAIGTKEIKVVGVADKNMGKKLYDLWQQEEKL